MGVYNTVCTKLEAQVQQIVFMHSRMQKLKQNVYAMAKLNSFKFFILAHQLALFTQILPSVFLVVSAHI